MKDVLGAIRGAIAEKVFDKRSIKRGVALKTSQANAEVATSFGDTVGEVSRANADHIRRFEDNFPLVAANIRSQLEQSDGDLGAIDYSKAFEPLRKTPNDTVISIAKTYAKSLAVSKFISE